MKVLSFILLFSVSASAGSPGGVSGLKALAVPEPEASPMVSYSPKPKAQKSNVKKGKRVREKEAEGSEAVDRFQADTVIKSQYELNGKPLEVDPD